MIGLVLLILWFFGYFQHAIDDSIYEPQLSLNKSDQATAFSQNYVFYRKDIDLLLIRSKFYTLKMADSDVCKFN